MRKSCLVQFVLLVIIVLVLSLAIRQALARAHRQGRQAAATPAMTAIAPQKTVEGATDGGAAAASIQGSPTAIQGSADLLTLVSSRPVMMADAYPVGLAASVDTLYLACERTDASGASVVRVSLADYTVNAQADLTHSAERTLGGMALGVGGLWVALRDQSAGATEGAGALLELDPSTLSTLRSIGVPEPLQAVAQAPDGRLFASRCQPGQLLGVSTESADSSSGTVTARAGSPDGVCYRDLEFVAGYVVGVATLGGVGVLDVLDPDSLMLVARHTLALTSARGRPVAGNAIAWDGAQLYFAPDTEPNPIIMAFRPRGDDLSLLIPARP